MTQLEKGVYREGMGKCEGGGQRIHPSHIPQILSFE